MVQDCVNHLERTRKQRLSIGDFMKVNQSIFYFGIILILFSVCLVVTQPISFRWIPIFALLFTFCGVMYIIMSFTIEPVEKEVWTARELLEKKMREEEETLLLLAKK